MMGKGRPQKRWAGMIRRMILDAGDQGIKLCNIYGVVMNQIPFGVAVRSSRNSRQASRRYRGLSDIETLEESSSDRKYKDAIQGRIIRIANLIHVLARTAQIRKIDIAGSLAVCVTEKGRCLITSYLERAPYDFNEIRNNGSDNGHTS